MIFIFLFLEHDDLLPFYLDVTGVKKSLAQKEFWGTFLAREKKGNNYEYEQCTYVSSVHLISFVSFSFFI